MERKVWIDNLKGILLFLIVLGHIEDIPSEIKWLFLPTDLLYVGTFFYLSGVLYNGREYSFKEFSIRKIKTLLIPYLSVSLCVSVLDWNLYLSPKIFLYETSVSIFYGDGAVKAAPLWFVSTLFMANLLLKIGCSVKNRKYRGLYFLILPFLCYYLYRASIRLPLRLDSAFGGAFLMYVAFHIKDLQISEKKYLSCIVVASFFMFVGVYFRIGLLNYNACHSWLSFPSAICGSFILSALFRKFAVSKVRPAVWVAENGLPILGFHCYVFFCLKNIMGVVNYYFNAICVFFSIYFIVLPVLKRFFPAIWGIRKK